MAAKEHIFDISAKLDIQEFKNALDQTQREISTRFDFKEDKFKELTLNEKEKTLTLHASSDNKIDAIKDVLHSKLIKRELPIKCLKESRKESATGGSVRVIYTINDTLNQEIAKEIVQIIKDQKFKVQTAIQGDEIRVKSKNIDDLQAVITHLRKLEFEVPLHFGNFR
ncbi:YajQ family cyclic di-GMP-binding protein [Wolinella succinogenes]|uniref:YajQ family cyclic di-GMP-binding protein n=1 Tax=Wolinella succinogenes TaxID=844 RepID=UPI0016A7B888|nr:YajQ family cyclic di-GMP-binding protein [Wolinella succinogenes]NLU34396.1 YajQ family cyclic di-GMP-binding protein [Wolinella succinogenes]